MVTTLCPQCTRKTPIKANNAPQYWYCKYCKAQVRPCPVSKFDLQNELRDKIRSEFPETTHTLLLEGEQLAGGPVVIPVPTLSKATQSVPSRPTPYSVLCLKRVEESGEWVQLGEVFWKQPLF